MHPTISIKIFGIALGLLMLMALVTGLSAWNLKKVNNEVAALADYYVPLEQRISGMHSDLRDELIHVGRLMQLLQSKPLDAKAIDEERRLKEEKAAQTDRDIAETVQFVQAALSPANPIDIDRAKVGILQNELPDISAAHSHLQETIALLLAEREQGNPRSIRVAQDILRQERQAVDKEIRKVTSSLQTLTKDSADRARDLEQRAIKVNWGITTGASILGLIFAALITRTLVKPVKQLLQGTKAVEQGDLSVHIHINTTDEIAVLAKSFNHMVDELKQKELIKETFGKYVDPRIVKSLLEDQRLSPGGERRLMTVFFSDLEDFTGLGERLTPDGVVKVLNQYFTLMSEPIRECRGIIDKYIGDAIMAFWGPPFTDEKEHAGLACLAALEQYQKLAVFRAMLPDIMGLRKDLPRIRLRLGIATGDVTVGNIGSEYSKGYTVIGDTVNLASRLEQVNKQYGSQLLISEETWKMAKDVVDARELDCIRVAGKSEPVRIFELLGRRGQVNENARQSKEYFEEGLRFYRDRNWERAQASFEQCLKLNPDDHPPNVFLGRLRHFREPPPRAGWDGVCSFEEK